MKKDFFVYCDGDEFPAERVTALEDAMQGFVKTDVPLSIEFVFVDEEEIQRLNREQRNTDRVTDVLSFPTLDGIKGKPLKKKEHLFECDEDGRLFIGSVAVCVKRAKEQAEEYGHSYERELHYLLVHGIMHCLGYDHMEESEQKEMREKEEYVLRKLGITRE